MTCQTCKGERLGNVSTKCSNACYVKADNKEYFGEPPYNLGIGGGDYVEFTWCLDCGQIQGEFPLELTNKS